MGFFRQEYWSGLLSSRGFPRPRDRTHVSYVSCIGRWVLYQGVSAVRAECPTRRHRSRRQWHWLCSPWGGRCCTYLTPRLPLRSREKCHNFIRVKVEKQFWVRISLPWVSTKKKPSFSYSQFLHVESTHRMGRPVSHWNTAWSIPGNVAMMHLSSILLVFLKV